MHKVVKGLGRIAGDTKLGQKGEEKGICEKLGYLVIRLITNNHYLFQDSFTL